jgi:hypothetical protein
MGPVQGVRGAPRSGKSRFAQAITLAVNGSLPRLGRKQDILELVPVNALPSGRMYAELYGDSGNNWAKYHVELFSGKVEEVEHEISSPEFAGCLIAQDWGDLIEMGDDLSLKHLYSAFGEPLDFSLLRGLNPKQEAVINRAIEKGLDHLILFTDVEKKVRQADGIVKTKQAELDALEAAEAEAGARFVECQHCGGHVVIPSPGRAAAKEAKSQAEQEKELYVGIASELKRLMIDQLASKREEILARVVEHMPAGIPLDLTIRKGRVGWSIVGTDGRTHGAKVSCGTERAALSYTLIRAWGAALRKSKGLPIFLVLDDINFVGLTLADRRKMLQEVMTDVEEGRLDQALAISADDIFPDGWTVEDIR